MDKKDNKKNVCRMARLMSRCRAMLVMSQERSMKDGIEDCRSGEFRWESTIVDDRKSVGGTT